MIASVLVLSFGRVLTYRTFFHTASIRGNDFIPDYVSAHEHRAGRNPYAPLAPAYRRIFGSDRALLALHPDVGQRNAHPPSSVVLALPLTPLPAETAARIWLIVAIVSTCLAVYLLARALRFSRSTAGVMTIAALATPIVEDSVRWGQSDGVVLLALVVGWIYLRRKQQVPAGVALGLATALKVFPWMMIVPLIRGGRRAAALTMVATTAVVSLASAAILGIDSTRTFLFDASPRNFKFWSKASFGSLPSVPVRWLAPSIARDPSRSVPIGVELLVLLSVLVCAVAAAKTRAKLSGDAFWSAVPLVLLASPLGWAHQLVLLIGFALVCAARRPRLWDMRLLVAAAALLTLILGLPFLQWIGATAGNVVALIALAALAASDGVASDVDAIPAGGGGPAIPGAFTP